MDFALSHEQQLVTDTVRAFVENELFPLEAEVERTGAVPPDVGRKIQAKVKALGFYAPNIPEEWGGGGLDHLTFTLLERELGRRDTILARLHRIVAAHAALPKPDVAGRFVGAPRK